MSFLCDIQYSLIVFKFCFWCLVSKKQLTSFSFTVNHTDFGQIFTVGITEDKSPIVDHNQNNDLTDEITLNDPTNYNILSVSHKKNSVSEITFIGLTPTGTTNINMTFYTTRK